MTRSLLPLVALAACWTIVRADYILNSYYCDTDQWDGNPDDGGSQYNWEGGQGEGSNRNSCSNLTNDGGSYSGQTDQDLQAQPQPSEINVQNVCGNSGRIDHYWNGNGYDMYWSGGDGQQIGTCYKGSGQVLGPCEIPGGSCAFTELWYCSTSAVGC